MWEKIAKEIEQTFDGYVDWEERFYECPECREAIYEWDWTDEELKEEVCPICGFKM